MLKKEDKFEMTHTPFILVPRAAAAYGRLLNIMPRDPLVQSKDFISILAKKGGMFMWPNKQTSGHYLGNVFVR